MATAVDHDRGSDRLAVLRWREKLGFGVGDLGFNLYWTTIASFLAAFYTDVFGISAAAAGTMLFVTRIVDACTDPLMGAVADRTNSRWGKFRPYLLFAGVPMAAAGVLTFTTPDLDEGGKLLWAYGTYTLMMLLYTVLSTPYSALSGVMTARSQERTEFGVVIVGINPQVFTPIFFACTGQVLFGVVEHFCSQMLVIGMELAEGFSKMPFRMADGDDLAIRLPDSDLRQYLRVGQWVKVHVFPGRLDPIPILISGLVMGG